MTIDTTTCQLKSKSGQWTLPLVKKKEHLYVDMDFFSIQYTAGELKKVHRHFFHPESGRLYPMMRRADPGKTDAATLKQLQDIDKRFDICRRNMREPGRFRVSLPNNDIVFNRTVCVDLMSLKKKAVLHIVDSDTNLNAACFLDHHTAKHVWKMFVAKWVILYIGYPMKMKSDQDPQFISTEWKGYLHNSGIENFPSGVESLNALG